MNSSKIIYTPEFLLSFNKKNVCPVRPDILAFFSQFPKNKNPYQNPHNANFTSQNRKKILPVVEPFSDDKIIFDLKELLLKVNEENKVAVLEQILKLHFTPTCEDKVAELLLDITVSCIFLVHIYVDIMLGIESKCKNVIEKINKAIINQIYHPKEFSSANDDIACETAEQKSKKWRIHNGLLISELFLRDKYHHQFMINQVLVPLINGIPAPAPSPAPAQAPVLVATASTSTASTSSSDTSKAQTGNLVNIEILNKIFPIVGPKLEIRHKANLDSIFFQLEQISKDKVNYPTRYRFIILDIIDLRKKGWGL